jgi:23S rRNA (cytosine1962-C5)-methyltransferase
MISLSTVLLKPGEADRVVAGHPWIYHGSILRLTQSADDGALVQVKDHRQRFLGVGFYNAQSKINVRMISDRRVELNREFFEERFRRALAFRKRHLPGATSFRVVNSEGDLLSGLIVDKYEDVLVVQFSSLGMDQRKGLIVSVLEKMFSPRAILERGDVASRKFEGLGDSSGVLSGALEGEVEIRLNGIRFRTNLLTGHKTGFYLDQQVNYQRVALLAAAGRATQALDTFCFQGGFGLHLAQAGVGKVHGLDQSQEAVQAAGANASLNGLAGQCSHETVNVFDWLKAQTHAKPHEKILPRFDCVVLDPPSFTRNRASVPDALRGYKEIHLRALKLLKPGGILATFCCSHHVSATLFQEVILDASVDARRGLRRVAVYHQSPDHPVIPAIPETEYLKGFAFEVLEAG